MPPSRWDRSDKETLISMALILVSLAFLVFAVTRPRPALPGTARVAETSSAVPAALAGVEQQGLAAGSRDAPATLAIYTDLRCVRCLRFAGTALPRVLQRYVATGGLRLLVRVAPVEGASPATQKTVRARAALLQAAAVQGHAYDLLLAWGVERSGNADPADALKRIGGIDVAAATVAARSPRIAALVAADEARFVRAGVVHRPTYRLEDAFNAPRELPAAGSTPNRIMEVLADELGA